MRRTALKPKIEPVRAFQRRGRVSSAASLRLGSQHSARIRAAERRKQGVVKLCECGCGEPAPIAAQTRASRGIAKGDVLRFVKGHHFRKANDPGADIPRRLTGTEPAWLEQAQELRASGLSYSKIATELSCTPRQVHYWLRAHQLGEPHDCEQCGGEFLVYTSTSRRYCSRQCWRDAGAPNHWSEEGRDRVRQKLRKRRGKKNPNWKTGKGRSRIRGFSLDDKGEHMCRVCGSTSAVHAHHVIPRSMSRAARGEILNCLPLCAKCHSGWHHYKTTIYRDVFTAEEWAYLRSVDLRGQDIDAWLDRRYPSRPKLGDRYIERERIGRAA